MTNTWCSAFFLGGGGFLSNSRVLQKQNTRKQHVATSRMCALNGLIRVPNSWAGTDNNSGGGCWCRVGNARSTPRTAAQNPQYMSDATAQCGALNRRKRKATAARCSALPHVHHHRGKVYVHQAYMRASLSLTERGTLGGRNAPLRLLGFADGQLTFEMQRLGGSYLHRPAYRLPRTVNHLVVGKSNIKFLKLSHGSAPHYSATSSALRISDAALSPAAASSLLPTFLTRTPVTSRWPLITDALMCGLREDDCLIL